VTRRVAVTGMGLVTPVGNDVASTWAALVAGESGAGPITKFDSAQLPVHFACEVKGYDPLQYMEKKEARRYDLFSQFAMGAAVQAVRDSCIETSPLDPKRIGVIIGTGTGGIATFEENMRTFIEKGPSRVSPFFVPMFMANVASAIVSMRYGFQGPCYCTVSACASSGHALGDAYDLIRADKADVMVAGGSEAAITPLALASFANMKALSERNDDPKTASRPFDKDRDGFVMGDGAAVVILEEWERAKARGANIVAEIVGYGATADAYHITAPAPDGSGAQQAMRLAMQSGGIRPEQVGYINAHGTSTPYNDKFETIAIKRVFGDHAKKLAVSSTKSMTGHLLGAAGGIEAIATAFALHHGMLPPTMNYEKPDPDCDLDYIPNQARKQEIEVALSNAFGFGGTNATLAFKKYRG